MKIRIQMAALLLNASSVLAMDYAKDDLSKAEAKFILQNEFHIEDHEFDDLYEKHGTYEGVWQALHDKVSIEKLSQEMKKTSIQEKSADQYPQALEEDLQVLDKQYEMLTDTLNFYSKKIKEAGENFYRLGSLIIFYESKLTTNSSSSIYNVESDIRTTENTIQSNKSTIGFNNQTIERENKYYQATIETVRKKTTTIESHQKTISQLKSENEQYEKENDGHHQTTLSNIRSGKYNNDYLELKQTHNRDRIKRNTDKIYDLEKDIRYLQGTLKSEQTQGSGHAKTIKDLEEENKRIQASISRDHILLTQLKNRLRDEHISAQAEQEENNLKIVNYKKQQEELRVNIENLRVTANGIQQQLADNTRQHKALKQKIDDREQEKIRQAEEQKIHVFQMVKGQFSALTQWDFNQLYALEKGNLEDKAQNIMGKLKLKEAQEKAQEEKRRLEIEKAEEARQQEEKRQTNLAGQLKDCLLEGKSMEQFGKIYTELKSLDWVWGFDGSTLLHYSVQGGNTQMVNSLLCGQKRININAALKNGESALHCAAFLGHVDIAKVLLNSGADVFQKTSQEGVSILEAAFNHLEGCVEEKQWDRLNNAYMLIHLILTKMNDLDESCDGYEGGTFPPVQPLLILVERITAKINTSSLEERRRHEEAKRLHDFLLRSQRIIENHKRLILEKKAKEKKRQEEYQRQQSYQQQQQRYSYRYS